MLALKIFHWIFFNKIFYKKRKDFYMEPPGMHEALFRDTRAVPAEVVGTTPSTTIGI